MKKTSRVAAISLLAAGVAFATSAPGRRWLRHRERNVRVASEVAKEIARLHASTGHYPDRDELTSPRGLRECDILRDDVCLFYEANSEGFVVGFCSGFDDCDYYDSVPNCWSFECTARSVPLDKK